MLFGLATNLFIFVVGRLTRGGSPILSENNEVAVAPFADPVPQALLLTAIVIGFGIQAFALVLIKRINQAFGTTDMDDMNATDQIKKKKHKKKQG
jgi:multicomponent Na+:H+ antiporter subunit C